MDPTVFRDDSTKLTVIRQMLTQANEMIGDVDSHLKDYGERLVQAGGEVGESHQLEIERLKQALIEKDDELLKVRAERLKLADDLTDTLSRLASAEQIIADLRTKRDASDSALEARCRQLEAELRKAQESNRTFERRLGRVTSQVDSLLRSREGLLDLVKASEVKVDLPTTPPKQPDVPALEGPTS